jgi:hypothetical protein
MTSNDGITWTRINYLVDNNWTSICWSEELEIFCAVSNNGTGRVITSPDGVNWTPHTSGASCSWNGICWSSELGIFCAVAGAADAQGNQV